LQSLLLYLLYTISLQKDRLPINIFDKQEALIRCPK
jgi:hypothetical protein